MFLDGGRRLVVPRVNLVGRACKHHAEMHQAKKALDEKQEKKILK